MDKISKIKLAIEKGIKYDPISGKFYGVRGNEYKSKSKGYIYLGIKHNGVNYNLSAHILAWYLETGEVVDCIDHINGIRDDNRISNLRSVTKQQNSFNINKVKGYSYHKSTGKYMSRIKIDGKSKYIGVFDTEVEAREAYLEAKKIYHII